jgi:hypothetical protein
VFEVPAIDFLRAPASQIERASADVALGYGTPADSAIYFVFSPEVRQVSLRQRRALAIMQMKACDACVRDQSLADDVVIGTALDNLSS